MRDVQASLTDSLSDEMRRFATRDLDKIVWIRFQIDREGTVSGVEIERSDGGAFIATLCEKAVRNARNPPVMSESVENELGSPLTLIARFEFSRPET